MVIPCGPGARRNPPQEAKGKHDRSVRDERRNPPDATKIAKVLIDIARNPDLRANEVGTDQTESAEDASRPPDHPA